MSGGGSSFGINWVKFALLDDTGKLIADAVKGLGTNGIYLADQDAEGATTANITGLEEKGTIDYANNKAKRVKHGAQTPTIALTMLDINYKYLQMMKGYVADGKGGYVLSSDKKPHVAMIICSSDYDGKDIYDCFANGEVIEVAHNHGTNNANETDYNATLEYDALTPIDDNVFVDAKGVQRPYKNFFQADVDFDEAAMMKEVFGGYVDTDAVSVTGISLNETTISGKVGDTGKLTATVSPDNATNKNVTFASSDATIVTVDSSGNYSLVKTGTATITATAQGGKTAACSVSVTAA